LAPQTVRRCLVSICSRKTRPFATSRESVTRRSGEPNLPVREFLEEPSGGGGRGGLDGVDRGEEERMKKVEVDDEEVVEQFQLIKISPIFSPFLPLT